MKQISFIKDKTFIIAEAGVNHNGNIDLAKKLIDAAIAAGADAVKFQCFQADNLVAAHAPKAEYQIHSDQHTTQLKMLRSLELSYEAQIELLAYCSRQPILFLSSPFDEKGVTFLAEILNLPIIKIPSGEITNFPLLLKIARTQKPVILSTGMSTLGDIEEALAVLSFGYLTGSEFDVSYKEMYCSSEGQSILREKVSLLHCTSEYPAPYEEVNLRAIQTLQQTFQLPTGYSDHTPGIAIAIAAVACGANIIEKHFTLDQTLAGPDHKASLMPDELRNMVIAIRQVEKALGSAKKLPVATEMKNRAIARKSLVALRDIKAGETFTIENLGCKRPGYGIAPTYFYTYMNTNAKRDYKKDELIGIE